METAMAWRWWILAAALAAAPATAAGQSSSLYQQVAQQALTQPVLDDKAPGQAPAIRSLVAAPVPPKKTFAKNDLITIVVNEAASHSTSAKMSTARDSTVDAQLKAFLNVQSLKNGTVTPSAFTAGTPAITGEAKRDFDGTGSNVRSDTMATRIEGRIVDIRPNGNLVIEASKKITTDEESYTVNVSGVCRTEDVTPLCTILSSQVAELTIVKTSTGAVKDATKRSWLQRVMDKVSPF
jgi:flagellar L-ring protein FlgH